MKESEELMLFAALGLGAFFLLSRSSTAAAGSPAGTSGDLLSGIGTGIGSVFGNTPQQQQNYGVLGAAGLSIEDQDRNYLMALNHQPGGIDPATGKWDVTYHVSGGIDPATGLWDNYYHAAHAFEGIVSTTVDPSVAANAAKAKAEQDAANAAYKAAHGGQDRPAGGGLPAPGTGTGTYSPRPVITAGADTSTRVTNNAPRTTAPVGTVVPRTSTTPSVPRPTAAPQPSRLPVTQKPPIIAQRDPTDTRPRGKPSGHLLV